MKQLAALLCLFLILAGVSGNHPALAQARPETDSRLVVFEGFLKNNCYYSQITGPVIDQLAVEYAGQPVVFIEYNWDAAPASRVNLWWEAYGGGTATLPLAMVDSGAAVYDGPFDTETVYRSMIDASLARPPLADVSATWTRIGNQVRFDVQVQNLSGVTLSPANQASVHAIVYEDAHVQYTDRFARAAISAPVSSLGPGETGIFQLQTGNLVDVDWDKLHFLALVDYLPAGSSGAHDILQAAFADDAFTISPQDLTLMVDPASLLIPSKVVTVSGITASWAATTDSDWIVVSPSQGPISIQPLITVVKNNLQPGWQTGMVTFTNADGTLSANLVLQTYLGPVRNTYLPVQRR